MYASVQQSSLISKLLTKTRIAKLTCNVLNLFKMQSIRHGFIYSIMDMSRMSYVLCNKTWTQSSFCIKGEKKILNINGKSSVVQRQGFVRKAKL